MIAVAEQASQMLEWQIKASWSAMLAAAPSPDTGKMGGDVRYGDETASQIVRRWADWINDVSADMEQPEWGGKTRNDVLNERDFLLKALSRAPVSGGEGEAVAWRWRLKPETDWWVSVRPFGSKTGEEQPLYTHPSDPSATERMRAEREDEIVRTATSLFNAFVGGSALRDVQNGTMTKAQADSWKAHAVRQHEQSLREMAGVAALGEA
ncbi:hypothetical protein [Brevundimonas sp. GCM10030266]|uniref:hypothetical protein n=1 Tax=Brevundimonas sp. GCM10030266 TaxID=3273386 RepID=UPI00360CEDF3